MKLCMIALGVGKSKGGGIIGGCANNTLALSKELVSKGHEIEIITTYPAYPDANYNVSLPGIHVHYLTPYPFGKKRYYGAFGVKAIGKITELHRKKHLDLICGHSSYPALAIIPIIAGKVNRLPKVHYLYSPPAGKGLFSDCLLKMYFSQLDMVITLSNTTAEFLKNFLRASKIRTISPCIDLSTYSPAASGEQIRGDLSLDKSPVLFFLGYFAKTKGLEVLLAALELVKMDVPDLKLLMGLNMPIEKYQSTQFKLKSKIESTGLNRHIIPLGVLNNTAQVMAACDIFVAPFTSIKGIADYPVSILEAMACGKPIIASNVGGISEIVCHGKTGLLIKPGDIDELASAILRLLRNKEEAQIMGNEGAKHIQENFKPSIIANKLQDAYQDAIKGSGTGKV